MHTEGPWFVHDFTDASPDKWPAVTVSCSHPDSITVAHMGSALTNTHEEAMANARLIAAAPDLLVTLEWLHRKGGLGLDVHERLALVIAKAKGELRST